MKINPEFFAEHIFSGSIHGMAISDEGDVYSWGGTKGTDAMNLLIS
jgi:alpha-tubulin suppressor-like RCC1 family protein